MSPAHLPSGSPEHPMDLRSLFQGDLPGCSSLTTTIQPADSIDCLEAEWAGVVVVVVSGRLHLECWSGERASFDEGGVLFLAGLGLRRITNPGVVPLVLLLIKRRPEARPQ